MSLKVSKGPWLLTSVLANGSVVYPVENSYGAPQHIFDSAERGFFVNAILTGICGLLLLMCVAVGAWIMIRHGRRFEKWHGAVLVFAVAALLVYGFTLGTPLATYNLGWNPVD